MTSEEIAEINRALIPIDRAYMENQFDPLDMMKLEIYPDIWDRPADEDDTLDYCLEYFDELKSFVQRANEKGLGLILYLS